MQCFLFLKAINVSNFVHFIICSYYIWCNKKSWWRSVFHCYFPIWKSGFLFGEEESFSCMNLLLAWFLPRRAAQSRRPGWEARPRCPGEGAWCCQSRGEARSRPRPRGAEQSCRRPWAQSPWFQTQWQWRIEPLDLIHRLSLETF